MDYRGAAAAHGDRRGHAGVEDTSAILYVKPEWVRRDKIAGKDPAKGVEGDPRSGRAELGKVASHNGQ